MSIEIRPLSNALGAEIRGVNLSGSLSGPDIQKVRKAFDDNIVIVFRDQNLSEPDQLKAAGYFGTVATRKKPLNQVGPGGDYDTPFMMVTNIVENGKPIGAFGDGEMWFHHDTSYYPEPHRATMLYAMKLTTSGGETCFSNMYKAYENIPLTLRKKLDGKRVLQMHDYKRRERLNVDAVDLSKIRHQYQPIFITHPATGRKALYVSRLMSAKVEGFSRQESDAILEQLFDISEDPEIVYEHQWALGDLILWDNWCSIHCRKDFPRDEPRLMRRLTLEGQAMHF
jgi:taurine dioxygenase